jgi:hypothetical protein
MSTHARKAARWIAAPVVVMCAGALIAQAAGAALIGVQVISGPSPFASCANPYAGNYLNAEVEPTIAASPRGGALAVSWQQDRWGDPFEGGAHGLVSWSSLTGKTSWAPFTTCSGGTSSGNGNWDRASDVWLSWGPDGVLYQAALVFDEATFSNALTVSRSYDGGSTWSTPTFVDDHPQADATYGDDKEAITADPYKRGHVYMVWDRYENTNPNTTYPAYFSKSTNGGRTWSNATAIYSKDAGTIGNQIVVLRNGTLLDFFVDTVVSGSQTTLELMVSRSNDQGATWSSNPTVVSTDDAVGTFDPTTSQYIRAGDGLFSVAIDRSSGALYATWQDSRFSVGGPNDQVVLSRSTDRGMTWSAPQLVANTPATPYWEYNQSFTPTVDVSNNGTVAVTYYDFRNNVNTSPFTDNVDYWAQTSSNGGRTWNSTTRLTSSSFPASDAPAASGLMIGDYEALTHVGNQFIAAFEVTNADPSNPTDIELARFRGLATENG